MQDSLETSLSIAASGMQASHAAARRLAKYRERPIDWLDARIRPLRPENHHVRKRTGPDARRQSRSGQIDRRRYVSLQAPACPGNPAADENGKVKMPNVDLLFEMADMREANRTYEANLQVVKQAADMLNTTIADEGCLNGSNPYPEDKTLIESVSGIGAANVTAALRRPTSATAPRGSTFSRRSGRSAAPRSTPENRGSRRHSRRPGRSRADEGRRVGDGRATYAPDRPFDPRQGGLRLSGDPRMAI